MTFSEALAEGSQFAAREVVAGKDARMFAHAVLTMSQAEFGTAFKSSAMKRAKLRGRRWRWATSAPVTMLPRLTLP